MMAARVIAGTFLDEVPSSAPGPQVLPGSRLLGLRASGISSIWCHQHVVIMQWVDGFLCRIPNPFVEYVSQFLGRRAGRTQKCHPPLFEARLVAFEEIGPPRLASPLVKFVC